MEDIRPECGGEEVICFVWTAGAEDISVEAHDTADARALVVSLSATQVLSMLGPRFFTYNRPMIKIKETPISLRRDICCRRSCVIGRISRIKSVTALMVPEIMKTAL